MGTVTPSVDLSIHKRKSRLSVGWNPAGTKCDMSHEGSCLPRSRSGISLNSAQNTSVGKRCHVKIHCSEMPKRFVFDASHVTFCKLNWLFLLLTLDWLPVPLVCRLRLLELLSPSVIQWLLCLRWRGVQQLPLSMRPWVCQETQKLLRCSNCLPIVLN